MGVSAAMAEHFPDEEATIVPAMEHALTQSEGNWFGKHGRAATPKGQLWNMISAIIAAQPDGGAAWLKKNMPGPAALAWRKIPGRGLRQAPMRSWGAAMLGAAKRAPLTGRVLMPELISRGSAS